jgi:periplasmic protein TonB
MPPVPAVATRSSVIVAWSVSLAAHGALLTAAYFTVWAPSETTPPKIILAKGDSAVQITILPASKPDPEEPELDATADEPLAIVEASEANIQSEIEIEPQIESSPPETRFELLGPQLPPDADHPPTEDTAPPPTTTDDNQETAPKPEQLPAATPPQPAPPDNVAPTPPPVTPPPVKTARDASTRKSGVETGVNILDLPQPRYPRISRRRGEEGLVLLQVEVLPDGRVGVIKVLRDPGHHRLTKAAIAAARKARFQPATRDGLPIRAVIRVPFRFVLR